MNKICMICSHHCSGSDILYNSMDQHSRIQGYFSGGYNYYESSQSLLYLTNQKHKLKNRAAIFMDHILFNYQISSKNIYKYCNFIYVLREPESVMKGLVVQHKYKPDHALRYYTYRLRRICEMAIRTPNSILLLWEDLMSGRASNMVTEYLDLNDPIDFDTEMLYFSKNPGNISLSKEINKAEEIYERYLFWIKNNTKINYWGKNDKKL